MEQDRKKLNMSWPMVVLFAVATGLYTGQIMLIDSLKDTSFQDIGISYEWWVVFAVFLVVHCEKDWEAMLKCFVFFLISQPLIYIVEVRFGSLTMDMAWHYYRNIWLPATVLTLPGGLIAYYCKKQNPIGAIILGLGNTLQIALGVFYFAQAISRFPRHFLSGVFCFSSVGVMSFKLQNKKWNRLIALVLPLVLTVALLLFMMLDKRTMF